MSGDSNPMQAYIEKELKERSANEITELLLDNCKSEKIVGLDAHNFEKVNHLSFIGCELESLDGLVKLPEVRVLDLSENKISSIATIPEFLPNLYHLNICGNPISTIEQLKPLEQLENLKALDIFDCPVSEIEEYRPKIFEALPNLKFLNGFDINDEEADDLEESDAEDSGGEMGYEDEGSDIEEGEEEEIGLDYLNSSKAMKEDDDSADFVAKANGNSKKRKANGNSHDGEEPSKKKAAEEA